LTDARFGDYCNQLMDGFFISVKGSRQMYTIYALADPRTLRIRYVGLTSNHPVERLTQHWGDASGDERGQWIAELKSISGKPIVIALEYAPGPQEARERERHWIKQGANAGWPLTNHSDGGSKWRKRVAKSLKRKPSPPSPPAQNAPAGTDDAAYWDGVVMRWFADNPQALTGPAQGVSALARSMAEHETGNADGYETYKSRAHKLFHEFRANVRLPSGARMGVDVSESAA